MDVWDSVQVGVADNAEVNVQVAVPIGLVKVGVGGTGVRVQAFVEV